MNRVHLLPFLLTIGSVAHGADVTGKWTAVFTDPSICFKTFREMAFDLKADGDRLTGIAHIGSWPGRAPVTEGKIEGDQVAFTVVGTLPWRAGSSGFNRGGVPRMVFKGTVQGTEMTLRLVWDNIMLFGDPPKPEEYDMKATRSVTGSVH